MKAHHGSNTPISERDTHGTPPEVFAFAQVWFGRFDFDAACTESNALATPVWLNRTAGDALTATWTGNVWCNPPYSSIAPWVEKAFYEAETHDATTVLLIPSPNGESYYERLLREATETAIIGRIAFIGADGKPKKGNNRGSSFFKIGRGSFFTPGTRHVRTRDEIYKIGREQLEVYS